MKIFSEPSSLSLQLLRSRKKISTTISKKSWNFMKVDFLFIFFLRNFPQHFSVSKSENMIRILFFVCPWPLRLWKSKGSFHSNGKMEGMDHFFIIFLLDGLHVFVNQIDSLFEGNNIVAMYPMLMVEITRGSPNP